jgi:foldase protein PrsA
VIRTLAALAAGAVLLTGCGETTAGVAARVGHHTIETSSFAARVSRSYENEQFAQQNPKDVYQRSLLRNLILTRLVEVAAERLGVTVSEAQVEAREAEIVQGYGGREAFEQGLPTRGYHLSDVRDVVRAEVLQNAVLDKLVEGEVVTEEQLRKEYARQLPRLDVARIAHIVLREKARAERVATLAKEPGADFAALAARYSQDNETREEGGELGPLGNGEGRFSKAYEEAVFAAGKGDVIGPIRTVTNDAAKIVGYEIVKVIDRQTRTYEQARNDLRRALLDTPRTQRFNDYISKLAAELGVKVNPRFGRWDQKGLTVADAQDTGLSSPAPEPGQQQAPGVVPGPIPTQAPPPTAQPTARPSATQ